MKSQFDELIGELDVIAKALPAEGEEDSEKVLSAAADGGGDESGDGNEKEPDGDADDKPMMGKSFKVTMADGSEVEAVDGAEMIKALRDEIDDTHGAIAKALGSAVSLIKGQGDTLKKQATLIKSLTEKVEALGKQGAGRKTVLSLVEKTPASALAKSTGSEDGMDVNTFMAKALAAQAAGVVNGQEICVAEAQLNRGEKLDPRFAARVMAFKG